MIERPNLSVLGNDVPTLPMGTVAACVRGRVHHHAQTPIAAEHDGFGTAIAASRRALASSAIAESGRTHRR